jgi:rod shape-determining protein MreD
MTTELQSWLIIPITLIIAFLITLLPMPSWTIWMRPQWVLMVVIFWAMFFPERINVGIAWVIGIFLDVMAGTLLGEHALAITLVVYFVVKLHTRLRMYPLLQQGFSIFTLTLLYQFILFCIQGFLGNLPSTWLYWSASVTSMLLWPWIFSILHNYQNRFEIV